MTVRLGPGWFGLDGHPLRSSSSTVSVTVVGVPAPPRVELRAPLRTPAPLNLRWLVVHAPESARLRHAWGPAEVVAQAGPERRIRVPSGASGAFDLRVDSATLTVGLSGPADLAPPVVGPVGLRWTAAGVHLSFTVDEPVWLDLALDGVPVPLGAPLVHVGRVELPLAVTRVASLQGRVVDLSGQGTILGPVELVPGPRVEVELTELVAAPLRDWGDSEASGLPFDDAPGHGSVTAADEWIELVNRGDELDLSAVQLVIDTVDGTPAVTVLPGAPGAYFGAGGSWARWRTGEALVLRPRGQMSSEDLVTRVQSGGAVLDVVRLGEGGHHPGGSPPDAVHEAIAKTAAGWRWCRPTPGDPRPPLECRDGP